MKKEQMETAGETTLISNHEKPGKTTRTAKALVSRTSPAVATAKAEEMPGNLFRDDLETRKEIIKAMEEEVVELDAFIKAKSEATGQPDPGDLKLRRKLVRQLSEAKKLFFPGPKVLTKAERGQELAAVQSWKVFVASMLAQTQVSQ